MLKKKCPGIETIIQYKPGAGGGLMWAQMNGLPDDGYNIVGINLPHIVLQPLEGQVQYKTEDITPVYWFHYTPDAIVVAERQPDQDLRRPRQDGEGATGKAHAGRLGNELGEPRGARKTASGRHQDHLRAVQRHGRSDAGGDRRARDGAMSYTAFAINSKGKVRALAVAMDKRHPLLPDVPTFKELGFDWVDGAYRGIGMPKSTPPEARKRMSDLWAALNNDPEMKELAFKSGFELVNVGVDKMDAFMRERQRPNRTSPSAWGSPSDVRRASKLTSYVAYASIQSIKLAPSYLPEGRGYWRSPE